MEKKKKQNQFAWFLFLSALLVSRLRVGLDDCCYCCCTRGRVGNAAPNVEWRYTNKYRHIHINKEKGKKKAKGVEGKQWRQIKKNSNSERSLTREVLKEEEKRTERALHVLFLLFLPFRGRSVVSISRLAPHFSFSEQGNDAHAIRNLQQSPVVEARTHKSPIALHEDTRISHRVCISIYVCMDNTR